MKGRFVKSQDAGALLPHDEADVEDEEEEDVEEEASGAADADVEASGDDEPEVGGAGAWRLCRGGGAGMHRWRGGVQTPHEG